MFSLKNLSMAELKNAFLNTQKTESQTGNCDSSTQGCSKCICGSPLRYLPSFKQRLICPNSDVKNSTVCSMAEIHCSFLTVTFACAHNYCMPTKHNSTWLKIIYRSLLFRLKLLFWPQQEWRTLCYYEANRPIVITKLCKNLVRRGGDVF